MLYCWNASVHITHSFSLHFRIGAMSKFPYKIASLIPCKKKLSHRHSHSCEEQLISDLFFAKVVTG